MVDFVKGWERRLGEVHELFVGWGGRLMVWGLALVGLEGGKVGEGNDFG